MCKFIPQPKGLIYIEIHPYYKLSPIHRCQPIEPLLEVFSTFTKTTSINLYLLPFCLAFDARLYVALVLVTSLTSYTTHILKWMLAGSRPYWWVRETAAYGHLTRPTLRQTVLTCETSAGNPSGHVMLNAAYLYVFVYFMLESPMAKRRFNDAQRRWLRPLCWLVYVTFVGLVATSRMYYGCHYMHQCVLGAALGYGLCRSLLHKPPGQAGPGTEPAVRLLSSDGRRLALLGAAMAAVAVVTWCVQVLLQVDPMWSIHMVSEGCFVCFACGLFVRTRIG